MPNFILRLLFCAGVALADDAGPPDSALIKFVQQRTNVVRITEKPCRMSALVSGLCRGPTSQEMRVLNMEKNLGISDPHAHKYVHVYVSQNGKTAMQTHDGVFPEGAIVLKEKFSDTAGTNTELFTGMVKREPGYNPECGDWEFFTLPGDASKISSRGKIENCMECHVEYKDSDFVTREYPNRFLLPAPAIAGK